MEVKEKTNFVDGHFHCLTNNHVPSRMFGRITPFVKTKLGGFLLRPIMRAMTSITDNNKYHRLTKLIDISGKSMEDIIEHGIRPYPDETKIVVIAIDMEHLNAGKVKDSYEKQVKDLSKIAKASKGKIMPVYHAHPEQDIELFYWAMLHGGYKAVKLYPPMGHSPDDYRLHPIYNFCNENNIPIIVHSGVESPIHLKDSKRVIRRRLDWYGIKYKRRMSKAELCGQFGYPKNYIRLIKNYPDIKWIYAHWGGQKSWDEYTSGTADENSLFYQIKSQLLFHENVYADISYLVGNRKYWSSIILQLYNDEILKKVIFGSDFYMVKMLANQKIFMQDFRLKCGEKIWNKIAKENTKKIFKI